ncbi:unnamed protein product [Paramecium sonneborni]|uniref:Uncharacterized protein n=1 Tax=Paramecium sonneborni TaxID=65129 RepID=A0A8S1R9D3_9CILI|nr:unnamed protein product [Paramecium sonneborni]
MYKYYVKKPKAKPKIKNYNLLLQLVRIQRNIIMHLEKLKEMEILLLYDFKLVIDIFKNIIQNLQLQRNYIQNNLKNLFFKSKTSIKLSL